MVVGMVRCEGCVAPVNIVAVALAAGGGEVLLVPAVGVFESAVVRLNIEHVEYRPRTWS